MSICFLEQEEHDHDMGNNDMICRYEALSKKCNKLAKENIILQLECDRLTTENQVLKRTTMRKHIMYILSTTLSGPSISEISRNYRVIC